MAKVNVYRFDEEELVDLGTERLSLEFGGVRKITRCDSADAALALLGISGMRVLNAKKHPIITNRLKHACTYFECEGHPVAFLRGVHGTFAITRVPSPKRACLVTRTASSTYDPSRAGGL